MWSVLSMDGDICCLGPPVITLSAMLDQKKMSWINISWVKGRVFVAERQGNGLGKVAWSLFAMGFLVDPGCRAHDSSFMSDQ